MFTDKSNHAVYFCVQVMKYEDQLEKLKLENNALSDSLSKNAQDLLRMEDQIHGLELELTISQEKHRTCQKEVKNTCFENWGPCTTEMAKSLY